MEFRPKSGPQELLVPYLVPFELSGVDFIKVGRMAQSAERNYAQRLAQNELKA